MAGRVRVGAGEIIFWSCDRDRVSRGVQGDGAFAATLERNLCLYSMVTDSSRSFCGGSVGFFIAPAPRSSKAVR